jgi:hypothetical protein
VRRKNIFFTFWVFEVFRRKIFERKKTHFFSRPFFFLSIISFKTKKTGVCHVALAQEGHCLPGEVLLGTDSVRIHDFFEEKERKASERRHEEEKQEAHFSLPLPSQLL